MKNKNIYFGLLALACVSLMSMAKPGRAQSFLLDMPVGTVIHSMLNPAQMNSVGGGVWVLMDGRSVEGSAYESITKQSRIPDARGLFLRAQNSGRSRSFGNPDGDMRPGATQGDQVGVHTHPISMHPGLFAFVAPGLGVGANSGKTVAFNQISASVGEAGGNETRPRAMTLYVYIKINES